jgi:hypothetical protein
MQIDYGIVPPTTISFQIDYDSGFTTMQRYKYCIAYGADDHRIRCPPLLPPS